MSSRFGRAAALVLLALAVLGACTEDVGTSVRVRLVYVDTWPMVTNKLIVDDMEIDLELRHELLLLVPDDRDGQVLNLRVVSTRDGEPIAAGSAVALVRKGDTVDAAIVMNREPCGAFCTPESKRCKGENATETCVREPDGCLEWQALEECPADLRICSSGKCDRNCYDECAAGEGVCQDATTQRACGSFDSDLCLDLGDPSTCAGADVCYSGRCRRACSYGTSLSSAMIPQSGAAFAPTLVVDPRNGMMHAMYSASGTKQLLYANRPRGGSWSTWTTLTGAIGENPTAAIDRAGRLHVVYGGGQVVYGVRATNGQWSWSPALATGAEHGKSFSIAVDAADSPHVVYHNSTAFTLHHAYLQEGQWRAEVISAAVRIGAACDIAFSDDTLHVSSYSQGNVDTSENNNVWYSWKTGAGSWTSEEISIGTGVNVDPQATTSIVIDRSKTVSVVYSNLALASERLRVVYGAAGQAWSQSPIDSAGGANADAVVDPFDNVHVVYRTPTAAMRYAVGKTSTWSLAVQPVGLSGFQPSIAVEPEASVYMVSGDLGGVALTTHACN